MKNILYEKGVGTLIMILLALALGALALYVLYMFILIFTPFLAPVILIFISKVKKLLSGIIGVLLFAYYVIEIKLTWPSSKSYFFDESSFLGVENLMYVNILNYIGLGISLFMIYLYVDNKKFR